MKINVELHSAPRLGTLRADDMEVLAFLVVAYLRALYFYCRAEYRGVVGKD